MIEQFLVFNSLSVTISMAILSVSPTNIRITQIPLIYTNLCLVTSEYFKQG